MSLSYLDNGMINDSLGLKQRVGRAWQQAGEFGSDLVGLYCEVTSSPQFRSVATRVSLALGLSFCLVHLAKFAIA